MTAPPEIVFDRVSKSFPRTGGGAAYKAVRDLSFSIGRGEVVAILGKTGCGKSTTFNLIAGLIRPSGGSVRVQGHDPYGDFAWFRGKIGIVFQGDRLMPWRSALENVALGLELNKMPEQQRLDIAASWLARLGLSGHEHDYPHALSAACASACRSRALSPASPIYCCATSRSARSTSTPATRCAKSSATCSADRRNFDLHHPFDRRGALARRPAHGVRTPGADRL